MLEVNAELIVKIFIRGIFLGGTYTLLSVGLTLIAGILRVINFAHGALLMMAMYSTFWLFTLFNVNPFLSLIVTVPLFFLVGMGVQKVLISPLKTHENQVLVTFAFAMLLESIALFFWTADYRSLLTPFSDISFRFGYVSVSLLHLLMIVVALAVAYGLHIFISRTKMGKGIWALAQDPEVAMLMGINIHRLRLFTFGLGIALVAITGAILAQLFYIYPGFGLRFIIICFVIVVLGGFGSIGGAVLGSFLIGFTEVYTTLFIGAGYTEMMVFLIFIFILIFRPSGLFGKVKV